ncbi:MAG: YdcH family protein [Pseudobdellovibrionaceae bacterium]
MVDEDSLREQLDELKAEHKALDEQIDLLTRSQAVDFLTIAKLKKEKLRVKDTIQRIESMLIPDILA